MAQGKERDVNKEAAWRRVIRAQAVSGMSIRSWCRRHRVKEVSFYWWRRELARRSANGRPTSGRHAHGRNAKAPAGPFVPVHVADDVSGDGAAPIEIVLSGGRRVRITGPVNREALAAVLAVLEDRPC